MWRLGLLVIGLVACDLGVVPFVCDADAGCIDGGLAGECEPEGFCSFPDDACASGRRFALHAGGELSEQCVEPCIVSVALGGAHGCVLDVHGAVWCWGSNGASQLGPAAATDGIAGPTRVSGLPPARAIALGERHSCAVSTDSEVYCWGGNGSGQTGDAMATGHADPRVVAAGDGAPLLAEALRVGASHNCALGADGSLRCWGSNDKGQLGGAAPSMSVTPVAPEGLSTASDAVAGGDSSCARTGQRLMCWGDNACGKLGLTGATSFAEPTMADELDVIVGDIALGGVHGCGEANDGIRCWGDWDAEGCEQGMRSVPEIGNNPAGIFSRDLIALRAGRAHSCLVDQADGDVLCWGSNACNDGTPCGQLGESATGDLDTAVSVPIVGLAIDLATSGDTSCAVMADGRVWCWGDNHQGKLGLGHDDPAGGEATNAAGRGVACQ